MKSIRVMAATSLVLLAASACSDSPDEQAQAEILIGHVDTPDHPKHKAFERFAEIVQKESDGRMSVEIRDSGSLGGDVELVEAVQQNTVQMTSVSNGTMVSFADDFALLDIPYLFETEEDAREVLDSKPGQDILSSAEGSGLVGLAWWEQGFRDLSSNREVTQLQDVIGLKIRTIEAPLHVLAWNSLGANATPMSWTEVFTSLQQGVIDGQENPLFVIWQEKLFEVQDHVTLTHHIYDPMPVVVNKDWLDSLSTEDRDIVVNATKEATQYNRDLAKSLNEDAEVELEGEGTTVNELTDEDRDAFRDAAQPAVIKEARKLVGDDRVDSWLAGIEQTG